LPSGGDVIGVYRRNIGKDWNVSVYENAGVFLKKLPEVPLGRLTNRYDQRSVRAL
jgi:hypothetical protein